MYPHTYLNHVKPTLAYQFIAHKNKFSVTHRPLLCSEPSNGVFIPAGVTTQLPLARMPKLVVRELLAKVRQILLTPLKCEN